MNQIKFGNSEEDIKDSKLWDKEKILRQVGQEEIFEYYLGIPINYRGTFRSPIRKDNNPTCTFTWKNGKLLFRDWAEPRAKDCFNIVQDKFSVDFYTAMEIIARDFNLTSKNPREGIKTSTDYGIEGYKRAKNNEKSIIEIKRQPFTRDNIRYLKSYHLNSKITSYYNVFGVKHVWLNGRLFYTSTVDKPALAYYFGVDESGRQKWKIYFYRTSNLWRFIGNTNRINGWIQLPKKGSLLVITKSLKDVMCLAKFGIPAIAMQGETQIPYDYIIEELKERFDNIYTLLDYDRTGLHSAWVIRKLYDIPAAYFGKEYKAKDFSDYLKEHGVDKTYQLILETLDYVGVDPNTLNLHK